MNSWKKLYQCNQCDKTFSCQNALVLIRKLTQDIGHQRRHAGEKPYKINQCDINLTQEDIFDYYKITYTWEKPYQCDHCDKAF